jgi:hypothetical protein
MTAAQFQKRWAVITAELSTLKALPGYPALCARVHALLNRAAFYRDCAPDDCAELLNRTRAALKKIRLALLKAEGDPLRRYEPALLADADFRISEGQQ